MWRWPRPTRCCTAQALAASTSVVTLRPDPSTARSDDQETVDAAGYNEFGELLVDSGLRAVLGQKLGISPRPDLRTGSDALLPQDATGVEFGLASACAVC